MKLRREIGAYFYCATLCNINDDGVLFQSALLCRRLSPRRLPLDTANHIKLTVSPSSRISVKC